MSAHVEELAEKVKAMSASQQLRLAAALIDAGKHDLAEAIVDRISVELQAFRLFNKAVKK